MRRFEFNASLAVLVFVILGMSMVDMMMARSSWTDDTDCRTDSNCDEGKFCYLRTKSCVGCLNCGRFQLEAGKSGCAKEKTECGDCQPGFIMDTGGHCDVIPTFKTAYNPPDNMKSAGITNWSWIALIVYVIVLAFGISTLALLMGGCFRKYSVSQTTKSPQETEVFIEVDHQNSQSRKIDNFVEDVVISGASAPPEEYFGSPFPYNNEWETQATIQVVLNRVDGVRPNILLTQNELQMSKSYYGGYYLVDGIIQQPPGQNQDEKESQDQDAQDNFGIVSQNADAEQSLQVPVGNVQIIEAEEIEIGLPAVDSNAMNAESDNGVQQSHESNSSIEASGQLNSLAGLRANWFEETRMNVMELLELEFADKGHVLETQDEGTVVAPFAEVAVQIPNIQREHAAMEEQFYEIGYDYGLPME